MISIAMQAVTTAPPVTTGMWVHAVVVIVGASFELTLMFYALPLAAFRMVRAADRQIASPGRRRWWRIGALAAVCLIPARALMGLVGVNATLLVLLAAVVLIGISCVGMARPTRPSAVGVVTR